MTLLLDERQGDIVSNSVVNPAPLQGNKLSCISTSSDGGRIGRNVDGCSKRLVAGGVIRDGDLNSALEQHAAGVGSRIVHGPEAG